MAACPGRAPALQVQGYEQACFRNQNPDQKFLCNICSHRLNQIPASPSNPVVPGIEPADPIFGYSGQDATIRVAQLFDAGDVSGYQAVLAPWLPLIRSWTPPTEQ